MGVALEWSVADLTEGERAVLSALRLWFRPGSVRSMPAIRDVLRAAGIPGEALLPLFSLLGVLAADSARPLRVAAPAALRLDPDEGMLLEALGALQHGRDERLDRWLPAVAAGLAASAARDFVQVLSLAGVFLPCRAEPGQSATRRAGAEARAGASGLRSSH